MNRAKRRSAQPELKGGKIRLFAQLGVRLGAELAVQLRDYCRSSDQSINTTVAAALMEYLMRRSNSSNEGDETMDKWTYRYEWVVDMYGKKGTKDDLEPSVMEKLNTFGEEGWELCHVEEYWDGKEEDQGAWLLLLKQRLGAPAAD